MNKDILYVAEDCNEVYHRNGKHLLYVYNNGHMVHISREKERLGLVSLDLVNQCSTRDFLEWNLLLLPKNIKLAIFEYKIDHDLKKVFNKFTLNSNAKDLLELVKATYEEGGYKDYEQEDEFVVAEDNFNLEEHHLVEIVRDFDYDNFIEGKLKEAETTIPFVENIQELLDVLFIPEQKVEEKKENLVDESNIPF